MSFVRTVLGDISPEELGVCYAHEHLYIGPSYTTVLFPHFLIDEAEKQAEELVRFQADGGRALIDSMPCDSGRDVRKLVEISNRASVHIVCPTGVHLAKYYDPGHWSGYYSEEELVALFVAEIEEGIDANDYGGPCIDRTPHRAGLIKIATDLQWTPRDRRIFSAAAEVHRRTGCPILTHTEQGELGLEQVENLRDLGVDLEHVCLSHTDRKPELNYHRELLASGVRLEYDSAFRWKEKRGNNPTQHLVEQLIEEFPDRIMLGMDAARRTYWTCHGGAPGMSFLLTDFSARLRAAGITEATLHRIFVTTPAATFSFLSKDGGG